MKPQSFNQAVLFPHTDSDNTTDSDLLDAIDAFANVSIKLPGEAFNSTSDSEVGLVFTAYTTPILFPLADPDEDGNYTMNNTIDSNIVGASLAGKTVANLTQGVIITLQSIRALTAQVSYTIDHVQ